MGEIEQRDGEETATQDKQVARPGGVVRMPADAEHQGRHRDGDDLQETMQGQVGGQALKDVGLLGRVAPDQQKQRGQAQYQAQQPRMPRPIGVPSHIQSGLSQARRPRCRLIRAEIHTRMTIPVVRCASLAE